MVKLVTPIRLERNI